MNFYTSNELERAKEQTNAQNNWKWRDTHVMSENFGDFEKSPIYPQRHFVRKKMSRKKKVIIVATIIMFLYIAYGYIAGFHPFEQRIILRNVRAYVLETHGLKDVDVRISNLYLRFNVDVRVEAEDDFWFRVRTRRFFYRQEDFTDNYLVSRAEHILSSALRAYVRDLTNGQGRVFASLNDGGEHLKRQVSLSQLEENPEIAFEKSYRQFWLGVGLMDEITDIDYDVVFDIYTWFLDSGLYPSSIVFFFEHPGGRNWERMSVGINYRAGAPSQIEFGDINSKDDLERLFEEDIKRRLGSREDRR